MLPVALVILAAGKGKRMNSDLPKVLHSLAGRPLIEHLLRTAAPLDARRTLVVVGHQADRVRKSLNGFDIIFVDQPEQLGTGHAVMQTRAVLDEFEGTVLVLVGDVPLLSTATLRSLLAYHEAHGAACTLLSARFEDPTGYGRIVRNAGELVQAVVEQKDATPEQRAVKEINSGIIAFESAPLWKHLEGLKRDNTQAEYYLTDLVGEFRKHGLGVAAYCIDDPLEVTGINSQEQLRELERIYLGRQGALPESD